MIYFFYGLDTFRLQARIKELRAGLLADSQGLDFKTLSAVNLLFTDFMRELSNQSLFFSQRLIVVEDLISNGPEELQTKIIAWLKVPMLDSTVVVFRENSLPDQRTTIFKALNKFLAEPYHPLTAFQARGWLSARANYLKIKLSPDASSSLLRDFNGDLWRLTSELDKLAAYADGRAIDGQMVRNLVSSPLMDNIFQVIDAFAQKKLALANRLINCQLAFGTSEQQLMAMLAYQFRTIALLTDLLHRGVNRDKLLGLSGLHPYVLQKTMGVIPGFSPLGLSKIFQWLRRIDVATKQGKLPPELGLDILAAQIANS